MAELQDAEIELQGVNKSTYVNLARGSKEMDCVQNNDLSQEAAITQGNKQRQQECCPMSTSSRQPDSLYAYLVCFCGVVCNLIMFGCSYSYGLLFPILLDEFKEGKAKTGYLNNLSISLFLLPFEGSALTDL